MLGQLFFSELVNQINWPTTREYKIFLKCGKELFVRAADRFSAKREVTRQYDGITLADIDRVL